MTLLFEPLSPFNITDLAGLYKTVYNRSRPEGHFEKKYAPVYPDRPPVGFLAYTKKDPGTRMAVGFYGALPCSVFSGSKTVTAAQCADAMTHPGFRRQGLFLELARLTMHACRQSGARLLFGFPNQYSLPGFLEKLGWEKGERMDCFRIPVQGMRLIKLTRRLMITGSLYNRYTDFVVRRYEPAGWEKINWSVEGGLVRDDAWINQKRRTGMRQLLLEKTGCWIRPGEELLVGDLDGEPASLKQDLFRLQNIARRLGLSGIQFHCSPGTRLHDALTREIPPVPSFTIIYKDFGAGIAVQQLKFTLADIDTF